jgi:hypothetical protein
MSEATKGRKVQYMGNTSWITQSQNGGIRKQKNETQIRQRSKKHQPVSFFKKLRDCHGAKAKKTEKTREKLDELEKLSESVSK